MLNGLKRLRLRPIINANIYLCPNPYRLPTAPSQQLQTTHRPTNGQLVRSIASATSISWPYTVNIDPFSAKALPIAEVLLISPNVCATPVRVEKLFK